MRYACRCSNSRCRARRSLARHPHTYLRDPKCLLCGSLMRLDGHRQAQRTVPAKMRTDPGPTCKCPAAPGADGQNMPHRAGSLKQCERHRVPF